MEFMLWCCAGLLLAVLLLSCDCSQQYVASGYTVLMLALAVVLAEPSAALSWYLDSQNSAFCRPNSLGK